MNSTFGWTIFLYIFLRKHKRKVDLLILFFSQAKNIMYFPSSKKLYFSWNVSVKFCVLEGKCYTFLCLSPAKTMSSHSQSGECWWCSRQWRMGKIAGRRAFPKFCIYLFIANKKTVYCNLLTTNHNRLEDNWENSLSVIDSQSVGSV